ncbi:hypothetical protein O181_081326 [Austropuccinia psidii MF-1]|uniref:Reverse transcriptase Ty1/copia-type domain-containing protein n=1 Tax=Austropuccinia psidii MF-1 TaxID=1389203 RepID=A0A9Q3FQH9_9BASI|nr:hypothetical protein [Austropuccinia psidii MF-1]
MSNYDSSVYWNNNHGMIIWLHVDNGVVFAKNKADLDNVKCSLCDKFAMKWDNNLMHIMGIKVMCDNKGFELNQTHLIHSIISKYWDNQSSAAAPLPTKLNLRSLTDGDAILRQSDFILCVGALSYVATGTHPDIGFSVNLLARHSKHPGKEQWLCLQHLLGYLDQTSTHVLCIKPKSSEHLVTVASSSCHAEFMALGIAARHSQWIQNLVDEILGCFLTIDMKCDNASCMKITTDCSSNKRSRHLDREFFISNQLLHKGLATLSWVCSADMLADIFTKSLGPRPHAIITDKLLNA